MAEGAAAVGVLLLLAELCGCHHVWLFAVLYVLHLSLFQAGQSMMDYDWDRALLETGAASILYAGASPGTQTQDTSLGVLCELVC